MYKGYEYRLYPTKQQEKLLAKYFGCKRFVYNWALDLRTTYYLDTGKGINKYELCKQLTKLKQKEQYAFLNEVSASVLQQAIQDLDTAFIRFFNNSRRDELRKSAINKIKQNPNYESQPMDYIGYPRYKTKKSKRFSVRFPARGKIFPEENKIWVPNIKYMRAKISRIPDGIIKSTTIKQTPTGKYYVIFVVDDGISTITNKPIQRDTSIGIDLGLNNFIITSNGIKAPKLQPDKNLKSRLKVLQRRFSRKVIGGKNREKLRIQISKLYEKMYNQKRDYLHKLSTQLVNEKQIDTFCLETLNIQGMLKNHKLAEVIQDTSWRTFVGMLENKAQRLGKNVLHIGQFEPSSKFCSVCGYKNINMSLSIREWTCPECGTHHDRDINAAKNIKQIALYKEFSGLGQPEGPVEMSGLAESRKQEVTM